MYATVRPKVSVTAAAVAPSALTVWVVVPRPTPDVAVRVIVPVFPVPGPEEVAVTPLGKVLVIESDTLPVYPLILVIVAVRVTLLPGFKVTDVGVTERLPIPSIFLTLRLNVSVSDWTPVPSALTVCVVVLIFTLVDAVRLIVPVLLVPGPENVADTPLGNVLVIESETLPVYPLTLVIVAVSETLPPGLSVTEVGVTERLPMPSKFSTISVKVSVFDALPVPLALTVCVVVPKLTLVTAVKVIEPVFPVPGCTYVAVTPEGSVLVIVRETLPV
jgi:hypothetical protein